MKLSYDRLSELAEKYGESFYILDMQTFENNYCELLNSFRNYYPNTHIAYSYKTNYLPCLCEKINDMGGYAEIVSEMELWLANRIGVESKHIFYNGPYKKKKFFEDLLLKGGRINLDGMYELEYVKDIALHYPNKKFEVGLRCLVDIGQDNSSRFGFDIENGEFQKAFQYLSCISNVDIVGLHLHLPFRNLESYIGRMDFLNEVIHLYPGHEWKYISVGGGYLGKVSNEIKEQLGYQAPVFDDYAAVIAKWMRDCFVDFEMQPELIIEPGSALVANAMKYITKVINIKHSRDRDIATLSGSTFQMNPSVKNIKRPISVLSNRTQARYEQIDLAGYTCIESDYLYTNYSGCIGVNDFVVFDNVGSYSLVMKPPFILPDIAVVEITESGEEKCLAKAQEAENIFARFFM